MKPFYKIFLSVSLFFLICLLEPLQAQVLVQSFDTLSSLADFEGNPPNLGQADRINTNLSGGGQPIFSLGTDEEGGKYLQMDKSGRKMRHFDRETGMDDEPFLRISFDFEAVSSDGPNRFAAFFTGDTLGNNSMSPVREERWGQLGIYVSADSFFVANEIVENIIVGQSSYYKGKKRVSVFMNNSEGIIDYIGPNGNDTTLLHNQIDVWVGEEFSFRTIPYNGSSSDISSVKFLLWNNLLVASARLDNLVITDELDTDPLPVNLLSFDVRKEGGHIALEWQTDWEKNSSHFEVERSTDGTHFTTIGRVEAQGESTRLHTYRFADKQGLQQAGGPLYYRLRQVDFDGAYAYSPVRLLTLTATLFSILEVGPNPFTDRLSLRLNTAVSQPLQLRLLNNQGQTVWKKSLPAAEGLGEEVLEFPAERQLKAGLYLLEVLTPEGRELIRLLKQ